MTTGAGALHTNKQTYPTTYMYSGRTYLTDLTKQIWILVILFKYLNLTLLFHMIAVCFVAVRLFVISVFVCWSDFGVDISGYFLLTCGTLLAWHARLLASGWKKDDIFFWSAMIGVQLFLNISLLPTENLKNLIIDFIHTWSFPLFLNLRTRREPREILQTNRNLRKVRANDNSANHTRRCWEGFGRAFVW